MFPQFPRFEIAATFAKASPPQPSQPMGKGLAITGRGFLSLRASFAKQSKLQAHHKIQPWDLYRNIFTTSQIWDCHDLCQSSTHFNSIILLAKVSQWQVEFYCHCEPLLRSNLNYRHTTKFNHCIDTAIFLQPSRFEIAATFAKASPISTLLSCWQRPRNDR